ncbi:MAG: peptidoglycan DD-metalloendopeptidase family protein [Propionibacteriaceae bacterium]|nr:peptidoglycan DD-metalloendopeptidase family protein [Propionibacteriaceae bacterium]
MRTIITIAIAALMLISGTASANANNIPDLIPPVPGAPTRGFSVGERNWDRGHRGVDLAAEVGTPVRAAASGTVRYAGSLAGRGVVSLEHGAWRTTYEPLVPNVSAGASVRAGDVIGHLVAGHPGCSAPACLHWGLTNGEAYRDPLSHVRTTPVRLLPTGTAIPATPPRPTHGRQGSLLTWPAQGNAGSPFGMRLHPILGYWRMHWGVDIGAACGTPLYAAGNGKVSARRYSDGYGHYLAIDLGTVNGARLVVGYAHAQHYIVSVGDSVTAGQVVGYVGTTGLSTGCHLHLELSENGRKVDPMTWF